MWTHCLLENQNLPFGKIAPIYLEAPALKGCVAVSRKREFRNTWPFIRNLRISPRKLRGLDHARFHRRSAPAPTVAAATRDRGGIEGMASRPAILPGGSRGPSWRTGADSAGRFHPRPRAGTTLDVCRKHPAFSTCRYCHVLAVIAVQLGPTGRSAGAALEVFEHEQADRR
jgi:hypothetical protein